VRTSIEERSAPTWTDEQLVGAARNGDSDAFATIYDRYAEALFNAAYRQLGNREEAADVVQDTFVLASERFDQLRDPSRLKSWLYAIATRQALRVVRARLRSTPTDEFGDIVDGSATPDEQAERGDLAVLLRTAAEGLSPTERVILGLHLSGMSPAEIAEAVGQRLEGVHVTLHRLRSQVELSLGALLMLRRARRDCDGLATAVGRWDGHFSPRVRKRVVRHLRDCPACQARRSRMMTPEALLALLPWLAIPAAIRSRVLERIGLSPAALVAGVAVDAGIGANWATEVGKAPARLKHLVELPNPLGSVPTIVKLAVATGVIAMLIGIGAWRLDQRAERGALDSRSSGQTAPAPGAPAPASAGATPPASGSGSGGTGDPTTSAVAGAASPVPAVAQGTQESGSAGATNGRATNPAGGNGTGNGATRVPIGTATAKAGPAGQRPGTPQPGVLPGFEEEAATPGGRQPASTPTPGVLPQPRAREREQTVEERVPVPAPVITTTAQLNGPVGVGIALPQTTPERQPGNRPSGQTTTQTNTQTNTQTQQEQLVTGQATGQATGQQVQPEPPTQLGTPRVTQQEPIGQPVAGGKTQSRPQVTTDENVFARPPEGSGLTQQEWEALPNDAQLMILAQNQAQPADGQPQGQVEPEQATKAASPSEADLQRQREAAAEGLRLQRQGEFAAGGQQAADQSLLAPGVQNQTDQLQQTETLQVGPGDPFGISGDIGTGLPVVVPGLDGLQLKPGTGTQQQQPGGTVLTEEELQQLFPDPAQREEMRFQQLQQQQQQQKPQQPVPPAFPPANTDARNMAG
jgi:RNA polymerase sigma factor (sigma-70 family)